MCVCGFVFVFGVCVCVQKLIVNHSFGEGETLAEVFLCYTVHCTSIVCESDLACKPSNNPALKVQLCYGVWGGGGWGSQTVSY